MLRIALVGAGAIAQTHAEAFLRHAHRCRIVAVCNRHTQRAQELIELLSLPAQAFASLEEAAQAVDIDAVDICLAPAQHADVTVWALEHQMDVLVEKPMANSLEECDRMIDAARRTGRKLAVIFQLRCTTPVQRVKQLLDSGRFGPVKYALVNSLWYRGDRYHDVAWRGSWELEGGGVLTTQAIHHLDLLLYLMGMPDQVTATMDNIDHDNTQCEDVVSAYLHYPDKAAQLNASLSAHGEQQELYFHTPQACLAVPWHPMAQQALENGYPIPNPEMEQAIQEAYDSIPPLEEENHLGQIANFLDALLEGKELMVDGEEGRKAIELTTAIYKSAALHQPVALPIQPDDPFYTREGKAANLPHFHEKYRSITSTLKGQIALAH